MIKNLIFDFGDVFINLDKTATLKEFNKMGIPSFTLEMIQLSYQYEMGLIPTKSFIQKYQQWFPKVSTLELIAAWNSILLDFPTNRLEFLKDLSKQGDFKLLLLSNTNDLHIQWVMDNIPFYETFKNCFDVFYLSHEINLRKPNTNIFEYVLSENKLNPQETLFIDDTKENTDAASTLGIHVWNNDPAKEDVIDLFTIKSDLF